MAVTFLCTGAKQPDVGGWKKLSHCTRCLQGTKELPLMLEVDKEVAAEWQVNVSFATH